MVSSEKQTSQQSVPEERARQKRDWYLVGRGFGSDESLNPLGSQQQPWDLGRFLMKCSECSGSSGMSQDMVSSGEQHHFYS